MLRFLITPSVDDQPLPSFRLWVRPTAPSAPAPADGDIWLDTSGTDAAIGNATAGTLITASADYLVKIRYRGAWQHQGIGGQKGQRATIPLPFTPARGTRCSLLIVTEEADRRHQLEGFGFLPGSIAAAQ